MTDMTPYERLAALPVGYKAGDAEITAVDWRGLWEYVDWEYADSAVTAPAPANIAEITHTWATSPKRQHSMSVALLGRLADGRWFACVAWCDTTGWGCQAGADWRTGSRDEVIRFGLDKESRARLGLSLPGEEAPPA